MNDQPVERTRHISITRTAADGTVSQTEVHITAVHHRSVDTGSAAASVQTDVHIVTEGDCFDPRTCCDERTGVDCRVACLLAPGCGTRMSDSPAQGHA